MYLRRLKNSLRQIVRKHQEVLEFDINLVELVLILQLLIKNCIPRIKRIKFKLKKSRENMKNLFETNRIKTEVSKRKSKYVLSIY